MIYSQLSLNVEHLLLFTEFQLVFFSFVYQTVFLLLIFLSLSYFKCFFYEGFVIIDSRKCGPTFYKLLYVGLRQLSLIFFWVAG